MTLTELPQDIILLVLEYLEAWDLLRCQLVCSAWKMVLSEEIYLRQALKQHSDARELRRIQNGDPNSKENIDWQHVFKTIATRYYHLTNSKARTLDRHDLRCLDQSGHWYPVGQWDYHESQPGGRLYHESAAAHLKAMTQKPYLFRPTLWSYDDGLIVFAPTDAKHMWDAGELLCFVIVDLESGRSCRVPFDVRGKIVRNSRLREGALVIEWAEKDPFHNLNLVDKVHRHFATCFDVERRPAADNTEGNLTVEYRSEWKIHFLGLPLTARDYFFSVHTKEHYALYLWQPNRSLWLGDEDQPIEALFIWNIETPSAYRPSNDPSNLQRPEDERKGPHMVARYSFRELGFLGIRQHANIALVSMQLDSEAESMTFRENAFVSGQGYFDPAERNWCSTTTTFPFLGDGPVWQCRPDVQLPAYRGHCTMESTDIEEVEKWFLPVMEIADCDANVRYSLIETCFTGIMAENRLMIRVKALDQWKDLDDDVVREIGAMGRIAGDERWIIGQNSKMQLVVARFQ